MNERIGHWWPFHGKKIYARFAIIISARRLWWRLNWYQSESILLSWCILSISKSIKPYLKMKFGVIVVDILFVYSTNICYASLFKLSLRTTTTTTVHLQYTDYFCIPLHTFVPRRFQVPTLPSFIYDARSREKLFLSARSFKGSALKGSSFHLHFVGMYLVQSTYVQ